MKTRGLRILGAAFAAVLPACGGGGNGSGGTSGGDTGNPAFPVTMTEPTGGQTFTAPATIAVSAVATDPASVAKVEFLIGDTVVATSTQPPFQATLTDTPAGIHTFVARTTDTAGAQTFSNSVTITVLPPGERPGGWMPIARVPLGMSAIWFVDANRGWIVGGDGRIMYTEDGGATLVPQSSGTMESLSKVQFIDAKRGWALGSNVTLLRTTDGGATWTSIALPDGSKPSDFFFLLDLSFVDSDTGWIVGGGPPTANKALMTKDGGVTWTPLPGFPADFQPSAVQFVDRLNGWIVAGGSLVLRTTDGGLTWTEQFRTDSYSLGAMDFVNTTSGWISRSPLTTGGILSTSDGGATWTAQTYPEERPVYRLDFVSPTQGWAALIGNPTTIAAGTATIIHTEDGGGTWTPQTLGAISPFIIPLFGDLRFVDANHGWALCDPGLLLKTTTGGKAP